MSFFDEVRRRNVHRVALFYLAGAWLLIQVVESLHEIPQWPQWRKDVGLDEETLAAIEFNIPDFGTE